MTTERDDGNAYSTIMIELENVVPAGILKEIIMEAPLESPYFRNLINLPHSQNVGCPQRSKQPKFSRYGSLTEG
jgi:hypothetical protein